MRAWAWIAIGVVIAGCSGSSSSGAGGNGTTDAGGTGSGGGGSGSGGGRSDGGSGSSGGVVDSGSGGTGSDGGSGGGTDSGSAGSSDAGSGSGTVSGTADGNPFPGVASAYWIGAPDSATTTVIYVFAKPVKCSEITSAGWDTKIASGTQLLEMKAFGTTPATYTVTTSQTPAPGEASVNYVVSSGSPTETIGSGGTVTLTTLQANTNATGSFALKYGTHSISGTFDAAYCAGGHEP